MDRFNGRLLLELPPINDALNAALDELPPVCQPVARHVISAGGKRLRPLLVVLVDRMFGGRNDQIYRLAASMEMLHAATLLHDDILDNAASRRGQAAAHTIFGVARAILAGDALLAAGNAIVASYRNPDLCAAYSFATIRTAAGEIMEMNSLGRPETGLDRYLEIIRDKTGCLIAQACSLGAIYAQKPKEELAIVAEYGENLGLAFQIVDDALDFAPESQTGKPRGGDLREGKMTLPIRLYRESLSEGERAEFDAIFSGSGFNDVQAEYLNDKIAPFARESLAFARDRLTIAKNALKKLPQNSENAILAEMADYVACRQK